MLLLLLVGPPLPLQYSNNNEQHYDEVLTLFEQIRDVDTPILMGDFAQGPASPKENISYLFPFHHGLMGARGFVSPYVLLDGRCSRCADNPSVPPGTPSTMRTHIYILADSYEERVISSEV